MFGTPLLDVSWSHRLLICYLVLLVFFN